jgi:hypothetical protein
VPVGESDYNFWPSGSRSQSTHGKAHEIGLTVCPGLLKQPLQMRLRRRLRNAESFGGLAGATALGQHHEHPTFRGRYSEAFHKEFAGPNWRRKTAADGSRKFVTQAAIEW